MGTLWWRHLRPMRALPPASLVLEPDAEVVLHVASHEAQSRGAVLSSIHLLYGLLQDDEVTAAIAKTGGSAEALEDRVLAELAAHRLATYVGDASDDARRVLDIASGVAQQTERRIRCVDLWAYLGGSEAAAVIEAAGVDRVAVLFVLCHGCAEPEVALSTSDVLVVLRNDNYTTQELVCEILQRVFDLDADGARTAMLATHLEGRGIVRRYPAEVARAKIAEARRLARARGFPLWVDVEPA